jgi:Tfp pilus assembly protein PilX
VWQDPLALVGLENKRGLMMKSLSTLKNKTGAALVTALLLMAVLSLIGAAAVLTSSIEVKISGNDKFAKDAFYVADAGVEMAPEIISEIFLEHAVPGAFDAIIKDANFLAEIMDFSGNDGATDSPTNNPDIQTDIVSRQVNVDIDRLFAMNLVGGHMGFGGYEGVGAGGAAGGTAVFYRNDSQGNAPSNACSSVETVYRKVVGVGGQ